MRSKNGTGTIRQKNATTWEGRYYFGGKRKSVYGKTEKEVRIKLNELYATVLKGTHIEETGATLEWWAWRWYLEYAEPTIRYSTAKSYEGYVINHIVPSLGQVKLKNVTTSVLQHFFNEKYENGRLDGRAGGLSPKTLSNIRNMMHMMFEQAVIEGLIVRNPILGVKLPRIEAKEMRVLSVDEQKRLENSVMIAPEIQALGVIIALYCGMRLGEILALKWDDVYLEENSLRVRNTISKKKRPDKPLRDAVIIDTGCKNDSKTVIIMGQVKTNSGKRTIYLADIVRESLLRLKDVFNAYQAIYGPKFNPYHFVLFNSKGYPMDAGHMVDIFHRCLKRGNIAKANFHSLRHTFATRALEKGCDPNTLAAVMGHAQASTSLNMYGHSMIETQKELMNKFNEE